MEAYDGEADKLHSETIALEAERDAALQEVARLREWKDSCCVKNAKEAERLLALLEEGVERYDNHGKWSGHPCIDECPECKDWIRRIREARDEHRG